MFYPSSGSLAALMQRYGQQQQAPVAPQPAPQTNPGFQQPGISRMATRWQQRHAEGRHPMFEMLLRGL
jgi:hypothetical protein